jgi:hypothetical protein
MVKKRKKIIGFVNTIVTCDDDSTRYFPGAIYLSSCNYYSNEKAE